MTRGYRPTGEARLWAVALLVSVIVNLVLLAWVGIASIVSEKKRLSKVVPADPEAQLVRIFPEMIKAEPTAEKQVVEAVKPQAVRTSADQERQNPPASRRFIGERNTEATSDRPASVDAPPLPSQAGREPKPGEIETTESSYQDGEMREDREAEAAPEMAERPVDLKERSDVSPEEVKGEISAEPGEAEEKQMAIREMLLDGPKPVDVAVKPAEVSREIKPRDESLAREGKADGKALVKQNEESPKPRQERALPSDPVFRGNQAKTAIRGSISRTGRSALDVADTPMGRYQSTISRAVELEWQRNCVRHRDFITPGFLTVRFFVESSGRVRKVDFLGEMESGQIQKGFTLNSIRNASIPPMPPSVRKEMDGDALELIFNFYF